MNLNFRGFFVCFDLPKYGTSSADFYQISALFVNKNSENSYFFQNLAAEKTYNNLDVTLKEANDHRNEWFEGVHTCKRTDSLYKVMETIVKAEVHRLVIVNDDKKVCGVVSLSDILSYLVLRPTGKLLVLFYVRMQQEMIFL